MTKRRYSSARIGVLLRTAREAMGLNLQSLAAVLQLSAGYISKIELGLGWPTPALLIVWAEHVSFDPALALLQLRADQVAQYSSRLEERHLAALAEHAAQGAAPRNTNRERTRLGMRAAAERGVHCGRPALPLPDSQEVLRLRLEGCAVQTIASKLDTTPWAVRRVLKQESSRLAK